MKELAKILVLESDEQTHVLRLLLPLLPCESEVLPRLLPRPHLSKTTADLVGRKESTSLQDDRQACVYLCVYVCTYSYTCTPYSSKDDTGTTQ